MTEKYPTILLIEDEWELGSKLKEDLELKKYRVDWQTKGERALQLFQAEKYDLCIIEMMLPGLTGLEFAREIRKNDFTTPLLFMSAKDDDKDMIQAFCSGGDDYIVKPFSTTELALRVYSLLRRSRKENRHPGMPERLHFGRFTFDYHNRLLCSPDGETNLTRKEAELLRILASNLNHVVKREQVLTEIWGENDYFMGRSMDVYIARLRKKLGEDRSLSIVNIPRMGFRLEVDDEQVSVR